MQLSASLNEAQFPGVSYHPHYTAEFFCQRGPQNPVIMHIQEDLCSGAFCGLFFFFFFSLTTTCYNTNQSVRQHMLLMQWQQG